MLIFKFIIWAQEDVNQHKESFDPDNPRDFLDMYLIEIENKKDQKSSFYGRK